MENLNEHFIANALSWGEGGQPWLDSLPQLIAAYEEKWDLKVLPPFPLNYNYVAPAERADGSPAVLKIGYPMDREFQTELIALEIFNGEGCASLLEGESVNAVALLERIEPGTPLSTIDDDEQATRIIASVIKKLHRPLPSQHNLITVSEWASAIPEY